MIHTYHDMLYCIKLRGVGGGGGSSALNIMMDTADVIIVQR